MKELLRHCQRFIIMFSVELQFVKMYLLQSKFLFILFFSVMINLIMRNIEWDQKCFDISDSKKAPRQALQISSIYFAIRVFPVIIYPMQFVILFNAKLIRDSLTRIMTIYIKPTIHKLFTMNLSADKKLSIKETHRENTP